MQCVFILPSTAINHQQRLCHSKPSFQALDGFNLVYSQGFIGAGHHSRCFLFVFFQVQEHLLLLRLTHKTFAADDLKQTLRYIDHIQVPKQHIFKCNHWVHMSSRFYKYKHGWKGIGGHVPRRVPRHNPPPWLCWSLLWLRQVPSPRCFESPSTSQTPHATFLHILTAYVQQTEKHL